MHYLRYSENFKQWISSKTQFDPKFLGFQNINNRSESHLFDLFLKNFRSFHCSLSSWEKSRSALSDDFFSNELHYDFKIDTENRSSRVTKSLYFVSR